jgi:hypothetical protein
MTANRRHTDHRFHAELSDLTAMLDRSLADAGPQPAPEVRAENKGFALYVPVPTVRGWTLQRECWSSSRQDLAGMARLRGITL